ncbi:MAG: transcription factor S [Acidobacteria bacterium]|nr:transcription factor S [Acidobacteriota bacterium]|tara:strand:- start:69 stop:386 length:318 start_codon:yes stop_codon:yes gene_type:complete
MFCQKCGSVLLPKKEGNKKVLVCSCGYKSDNVEQTKITETVTKKSREVEVIEREDYETLPKTNAKCEKCGHKTAYFWTVQTRAGDEPETKFLKCEKCKAIWRDYD